MAEEEIEKRGIWLLKHPVSKYYVENHREIKRMATAAYVKIYDEKLEDRVDPELVVDHELTLIGAEKTKVIEDKVEDNVDASSQEEQKEEETSKTVKTSKKKSSKKSKG